MLVEATAAYHRESSRGVLSDAGGRSAAQLRDTPGILWQQQHNLLDPLFQADPGTPGYQRPGSKVFQQCQPVGGFDPCPVLGYQTGGRDFIPDATLQRLMATLKLTNFLEWQGHHQIRCT